MDENIDPHTGFLLTKLAKYKRRKDRPLQSQLRAIQSKLGDFYDQNQQLYENVASPFLGNELEEELVRVSSELSDCKQMLKSALKERDDALRETEKLSQKISNQRNKLVESPDLLQQYQNRFDSQGMNIIAEYTQRSSDLQESLQRELLALQEREMELSQETDRIRVNAIREVECAVQLAAERCQQRVTEVETVHELERSKAELALQASWQRVSKLEESLKSRYSQFNRSGSPVPSSTNDYHNRVLEVERECSEQIETMTLRIEELQNALCESRQKSLQYLKEKEDAESKTRSKIRSLMEKNSSNLKEIDHYYSNNERRHRESTLRILNGMENERRQWLEEATKRFRELEESWDNERRELLETLSRTYPTTPLGQSTQFSSLLNSLRSYVAGLSLGDPTVGMLLVKVEELGQSHYSDISLIEASFSTKEIDIRNKYEGRITQLSLDYHELQDQVMHISHKKALQVSTAFMNEVSALNQALDDLYQEYHCKSPREGLQSPKDLSVIDLESQVSNLNLQLRRERQKAQDIEEMFNFEKAEWLKTLQRFQQQTTSDSPLSELADQYRKLFEASEQRRQNDAKIFQDQLQDIINTYSNGSTTPNDILTKCAKLYSEAERRRREEAQSFAQQRASLLEIAERSSRLGNVTSTHPLVEHYRLLYESQERQRASEKAEIEIYKNIPKEMNPIQEQDHYRTLYEIAERRRADDAAAFEIEKNRIFALLMKEKNNDSDRKDDNSTSEKIEQLARESEYYRELYEASERRRAEEISQRDIERNRNIVATLPLPENGNMYYQQLYEHLEQRRAQDIANFEIEKARMLMCENKSNDNDEHYRKLYEESEKKRTQMASEYEIERQRLLSATKEMINKTPEKHSTTRSSSPITPNRNFHYDIRPDMDRVNTSQFVEALEAARKKIKQQEEIIIQLQDEKSNIYRISDGERMRNDFENKFKEQENLLLHRRSQLEMEFKEKESILRHELLQQLENYKSEMEMQLTQRTIENEREMEKYRATMEQEIMSSSDKRVQQLKQVMENVHQERVYALEETEKELRAQMREKERVFQEEKDLMEGKIRQQYETVLQKWKADIKADVDAMQSQMIKERNKLEEERHNIHKSMEQVQLNYEKTIREQVEQEMNELRRKALCDTSEREKQLTKEIEEMRERHKKREAELRQQLIHHEEELRSKYLTLLAERDRKRDESDRKRREETLLAFEQIQSTIIQQETASDTRMQEYEKAVRDKYEALIRESQSQSKLTLEREKQKVEEERARLEQQRHFMEARMEEQLSQLERECRAKWEAQKDAMIKEHDLKVKEVKKALEKEIEIVDGKIIERERDLERRLLNYEEEIRNKYDERYQALEKALHEEIEQYNARIRREREERMEKDHQMWAQADLARMEFEENLRRKYEEALRLREEKYKIQLQRALSGVM